MTSDAPVRDRMAARLERAFERPDERFCFYSANGAETGSARLNAMPRWDWTPYPTLGGGGSTCLVPLAFGCEPITLADGHAWVKPRIRDPAQVADLAVPDPREGPPAACCGSSHGPPRTWPRANACATPTSSPR